MNFDDFKKKMNIIVNCFKSAMQNKRKNPQSEIFRRNFKIIKNNYEMFINPIFRATSEREKSKIREWAIIASIENLKELRKINKEYF